MKKLFLLIALLTGCATTPVTLSTTAPIVVGHLWPAKYGETYCSWNNLPIVSVDSTILDSPEAEIIIAHERAHVESIQAYKGGCWPYLYRYNQDKAFRAREELKAQCAAGKAAMARNRNPIQFWDYITRVLQPDTLLTSKDNCLYEPF